MYHDRPAAPLAALSGDKIRWGRAEPLALLSIAEITRLLDPWLAGRDVIDAELLRGGLSNRNFLLRLSGRPTECVLRVYDRDPSACAKEVAVLGLIGRDVPVPRVLYADDGRESGTALAVLSVVEGIPLVALRQMGDADELADAVRDTGRVLARLAAYPGPPTQPESIVSVVGRLVSAPLFEERIPATTTEAVVRLAEDWQPRLDVAVRHTGLVHGDFNSPNVFVTETDDGWRVSAVLDWEFARDASPFADVGNFLRYHRADRPRYEPHFSRGLVEGGMTLPDNWLMLARLADLPALCELLGRRDVPDAVVAELRLLIDETLARPHG